MDRNKVAGDNVAVLHPERPPAERSAGAVAERTALQGLAAAALGFAVEPDRDKLLAHLLAQAVCLTDADAGGIYVLDEEGMLKPETVQGSFARIAGNGEDAGLPPIPLYVPESGQPNHRNVESYVVLTGRCVNVADAYANADGMHDFSGVRELDARTGYRSVSFLSVPLKTAEEGVIGVLQLVNAADAEGRIVPFAPDLEPLVASLAAQAALLIEVRLLRARQIEHFEDVVNMVTAAIDAKSPYTAAHCRRVPVIYQMLADAACASGDGPFADFDLDDARRRELRIAAWLHDCGKLATPEHVVDKATKLECVYDRLHEIAARFEIVKRDEEIACLEACMRDPGSASSYRADLYTRLRRLDEDYWFLTVVNRGDERMDDSMIERVRAIASLRWRDQSGLSRPLLYEDEVKNLCIRRGTLNDAERQIINQHVEVSIAMLRELRFPPALAQVLEIAGKHHEMIDGSGYPYGLTGAEMSLPARMLVIADVFEALTAGDRPYKKGKTLSEALHLMAEMRDAGKIDAQIFDLFLTSRVWQRYADEYMDRDYRNGVDIAPLRARQQKDEQASRLEAG